MKCKEFILSWVHGNSSLWLDREYSMHVQYIHRFTRLSMEGQDVTQGFQGAGKRGRKKDEPSLYQKYGTTGGGHGAKIAPITSDQVYLSCHFIAGKVMCNYNKTVERGRSFSR